MASPTTLAVADILEVANKLGVTRNGLQAQLSMADREGELDVEPTLDALRALLAILALAEGTP